jgi:hypothetical protein
MNEALFIELMRLTNEALTAATVIVAASLLFYNLSRGLHDRVTRASSTLIGCVTAIYVGQVLVSLSSNAATTEVWHRLSWIGFSFAPAALFHLSDALLATTGLISRGRRRRIVRILYLYSVVLLIIAVFTNLIIHDAVMVPLPMMNAGPLFSIYIVFYVLASVFAFNNVLRARRRSLTTATHRRLSYLLLALVTPIIGIFPYSLLFAGPSESNSALLWLLVNLRNLGIVLMLIFMAYPLAFFGPNKPDRVIKAELLSFMLRGPVLAVSLLLVILFVPRLQVIGIPASQLMPFVAVAVVLCLQWGYTMLIPYLEHSLIYTEDQEQAREIKTLSERLMTPADARQLLEAILASACDYLRVPSAFVVSLTNGRPHIERDIGSLQPARSLVEATDFVALLGPRSPKPATNGSALNSSPTHQMPALLSWESYWLMPLYSKRGNGHTGQMIGVMGLWARAAAPDLLPEEEAVFEVFYTRAARIIDDMSLQQEVFARLEDVLEETTAVQQVPDSLRRGYKSEITGITQSFIESPEFATLIKDALRDYWGGPRLTDERLLSLKVVSRAMQDNEGNPARAVRAVLARAIERLKPEGTRNMTMTEWTLYNIIDLRFVQGRKVKEVAPQLAISEADLYRKQNVAVQRVAEEVADMERQISLQA